MYKKVKEKNEHDVQTTCTSSDNARKSAKFQKEQLKPNGYTKHLLHIHTVKANVLIRYNASQLGRNCNKWTNRLTDGQHKKISKLTYAHKHSLRGGKWV